MAKIRIPHHGKVIDTKKFLDGINWDDLSELERVILLGELPRTDRLIDEINDCPQAAILSWDDGRTLLHIASSEGYIDVASLLVMNGAKIDAFSRSCGVPLHMAAEHGHDSIVKLLIQNKANVDIIDAASRTPLHYAVVRNNVNIVVQLLEAGASPNVEDRFGLSPLDLAALNSFVDVAQSLLKHEAVSKKLRTQEYVLSLHSSDKEV